MSYSHALGHSTVNLIARLITLLLSFVFVTSAGADVFEGMRAYHAKDYSAAFDAFRAGAKSGDAASQYYLAGLYADGLGVQSTTRVPPSGCTVRPAK